MLWWLGLTRSRNHLKIKCKDETTMVFIMAASTIPENLKGLWDKFAVAMDEVHSKPFDSRDPDFNFLSWHFSMYARYGEKVSLEEQIDRSGVTWPHRGPGPQLTYLPTCFVRPEHPG